MNYTPEGAIEFDKLGNAISSLNKAYRPGEVEIFIGKRRLPLAGLLSA
ncbi:MAG: hypothetical protein ACR652_11745 [Methylocystis sp.]